MVSDTEKRDDIGMFKGPSVNDLQVHLLRNCQLTITILEDDDAPVFSSYALPRFVHSKILDT